MFYRARDPRVNTGQVRRRIYRTDSVAAPARAVNPMRADGPHGSGAGPISLDSAEGKAAVAKALSYASANLPRTPDFSHSAAAGDVDGNGTVDLYVGNLSSGCTGCS